MATTAIRAGPGAERTRSWAPSGIGGAQVRIALGLAMAASVALGLWLSHNTIFSADELHWMIDSRDLDLRGAIEPYNGHLILVPRLVYSAILNLSGVDYLPFRLLASGAVVLPGRAVLRLRPAPDRGARRTGAHAGAALLRLGRRPRSPGCRVHGDLPPRRRHRRPARAGARGPGRRRRRLPPPLPCPGHLLHRDPVRRGRRGAGPDRRAPLAPRLGVPHPRSALRGVAVVVPGDRRRGDRGRRSEPDHPRERPPDPELDRGVARDGPRGVPRARPRLLRPVGPVQAPQRLGVR